MLTPFLTPTALLVYRVFRNEAKRTTKILHGLLHGFAFIIALVGEFPGTALPPGLPGVPGGAGTLGAGTGAQKSRKSRLVRFLLGHLALSLPPLAHPHVTPVSVQAWWQCSTTTGRRAMLTCTACTAGVASLPLFSMLCR